MWLLNCTRMDNVVNKSESATARRRVKVKRYLTEYFMLFSDIPCDVSMARTRSYSEKDQTTRKHW